MTEEVLTVSLYDQQVGRLVRRGGGSVFYPDPEWVRQDFRPILGLGWLIGGGSGERVANNHLPEWFENLLPEPESVLRQRLATALGIRTTASFALLARLGADLPGAVVVRPEGIVSEEQASAAEPTNHLHFSLAGMQLKFSVNLRNHRVALPLKGEWGQWILKLATGDVSGIAEIEDATMRWAGMCGFEVPEHRTVRIRDLPDFAQFAKTEDERAFLIRRYDRGEGETRIHQEDFAQVYEVVPRHKYSEDGWRGTSYDALARLVLDAAGEPALLEYIRRLIFVIASGNTDAHLKNWSFLHPLGERPRLSPLYDQVCVIAWEQYGWNHPKPPTLALSLGGYRSLEGLEVGRFTKLSRRVGMSDAHLQLLIRDTLEKIWSEWERLDAPERMRAAVESHRQRLRWFGR